MSYCVKCGTEVASTDVFCHQCGCRIQSGGVSVSNGDESSMRWMIPVGRPFSAIAAGYLGLLSPLPFFGVAAVICGFVALKAIRRNPDLCGAGRAWFGIVFGGLMTVLYLALLVACRLVK